MVVVVGWCHVIGNRIGSLAGDLPRTRSPLVTTFSYSSNDLLLLLLPRKVKF